MNKTKTGFLILALWSLPLGARAQAGPPQGRPGNAERPGTCPCGEGMGPRADMMGPGMMGMGPGMGPGMMGPGRGGMHGMMGPGMMMDGLHALDLTDKQRGQISEIEGKAIKPRWDLATKLKDARQKLEGLYAADKVDPKQVGAIVGNMGQLHQQMAELDAQTYNSIMSVLTPQQRQQLSSARRGMWGQAPQE